jgi:hypothetical protein
MTTICVECRDCESKPAPTMYYICKAKTHKELDLVDGAMKVKLELCKNVNNGNCKWYTPKR